MNKREIAYLGAFVLLVYISVWLLTAANVSPSAPEVLEQSLGTEGGYADITPPDVSITLPSTYSEDECHLAPDQLAVVQYSYWYGKEWDVGYTLAAIAIQESNAGRWPVNLQDPSAGFYHVTLDKVIAALDWEDTKFNRNRAAGLLVNDPAFSASLAVKELLFWRDRNSGDWYEVWASYHKGGRGMSNHNGRLYANKIRGIIQKIKMCKWTEGL